MRKGDVMALLEVDMIATHVPMPLREYAFALPRRWRFDFCWPDKRIALEVDGGVYAGGRHTSGVGYTNDCRKLNAATLLGWKVYRVTPEMIRDGDHMPILESVK